MLAGSNLFDVGVVTWGLGGYLTGTFSVSQFTKGLLIKNVLFCYH